MHVPDSAHCKCAECLRSFVEVCHIFSFALCVPVYCCLSLQERLPLFFYTVAASAEVDGIYNAGVLRVHCAFWLRGSLKPQDDFEAAFTHCCNPIALTALGAILPAACYAAGFGAAQLTATSPDYGALARRASLQKSCGQAA
jgi:hypothetical protein